MRKTPDLHAAHFNEVPKLATGTNHTFMLTRNLIEAELSLAYVQAVAGRCGFSADVPRIDNDSVDCVISASGKISDDSEFHSPKIEIQLKATFNWTINADDMIPFSLSMKNYDDLRKKCLVPRLLVVLCLPTDEALWLSHKPDELILRKCAYWLNLHGAAVSNNDSNLRVYLPVVQQFSPTDLKALMNRASKLQPL